MPGAVVGRVIYGGQQENGVRLHPCQIVELFEGQISLKGTLTLHSKTAARNGGDFDFDMVCVVEGDKLPRFVEDRFSLAEQSPIQKEKLKKENLPPKEHSRLDLFKKYMDQINALDYFRGFTSEEAMGEAPKYPPGGQMSYRRVDGSRHNDGPERGCDLAGDGYATPEERDSLGPHRARVKAGDSYTPDTAMSRSSRAATAVRRCASRSPRLLPSDSSTWVTGPAPGAV